MDNNVGLFLTKRARLQPDREAYVEADGSRRLTFAELADRAHRLGNALLADGVAKGDRVGLLLMNSAEFMEAFFAIGLIGAVVVPLNWRLVPDELEFILKDAGVTRLLFDADFAGPVAELHSRGDRTDVEQWLQVSDGAVAPFAVHYQGFRDGAPAAQPAVGARDDDLLYIMYTSGTTGLPKGVVHSHNTATWAVITIAATSDLRPGDRYLAPLPMFHVGALTPLTGCVYGGVTSIVMRSFDPRLAWQAIGRERVTSGLCVPAMLNFMLQAGVPDDVDHSSLRWIMSGAAPVPVPLIRAYEELGIEIHQVYGLTETCGPACLIDADNALLRAGSTGQAFFHTEVRIVAEDGQDCAPGTPGEVWVKGRHIMKEYWHRPEATAEVLVDGWLRTGDVAVMDDAGFVTIQDRIKDMIISGGENVYPAEIEQVLAGHDGIADAGVIGQPSARWGESPFAVVVRRDPALTEQAVLEWCNGKLAPFKRLVGVAFVDDVPRNPSGKILKRLLREQYPGPAPV